MKKYQFNSHKDYLFNWRISRFGKGIFTMVLFLGTAMWFVGAAHLFAIKTTEVDSTLHNREVLSAIETKNKQLLATNAGSKLFDCDKNDPVKGVIDLNSNKVYFEPKNPSYLYTKPDSCFPNYEIAELEGYTSDPKNNLNITQNDASNPKDLSNSSSNQSATENISVENTNPENIIYESVSQDLKSNEVTKSANKADKTVEDLPKDLTFDQMLERSKQTKIIVVSLENQNLKTLESGEVKNETKITSGKDKFESPKGSFLIINKARNIRLKSPGPRFGDYDLAVKYWLGFGNGYGFHDASWRSTFGGENFHTTGSHGCINMPLDAVKNLYGWADTDTEVYII